MSFQLLGNTKSLTHPHTSSQEHSTTALANAVRSAHVPGAKPQEMGGGGERIVAQINIINLMTTLLPPFEY